MKKRLIAVFLLIVLTFWLIPIPVSGQTVVTIHEPHEVQEIKPTNAIPVQTNLISEHSAKSSPSRKLGNGDSRQTYSGRNYSVEEVKDLIISYAASYGILPETPLCIAKLESGYNQFSANRNSTAKGIFQYLNGTWNSTDEGKAGLSVFDADANVKAAVKYMASRKNAKPWVVASKCPPVTKIN